MPFLDVMIKSHQLSNGKIYVEQKAHGPTVYLDQWMWCRLSKDSDLRDRFIEAATARQSCIMYSIASLMELVQIQDDDQLLAILEVMDSLDFGFIRIDPVQVIDLEQQHESETLGVFNERHPAMDRDLLNYAIRRHYPDIPVMSTILDDLKEEAPTRYSALSDRLAASWTPMVNRARSDLAVLERAKNNNRERKLCRPGPPYTEDILRILNFFLVANETMSMNRNEWIDILHMVVPVAYLEHVVLDKRWLNFIRNHLPLSPPNIARVYGPHEIELLLQDMTNRDFKAAAL